MAQHRATRHRLVTSSPHRYTGGRTIHDFSSNRMTQGTQTGKRERVTRGGGLLEYMLARKRAKMADKLIPDHLRNGTILDIGCGSYPYFLTRIEFAKKMGIDQFATKQSIEAPRNRDTIQILGFDVEEGGELPYKDNQFDVITMLAVFEHLKREPLVATLNEIDRILNRNGVFIMTTPAGWTGPILDVLTRLNLVSAEEIDEHEDSYSKGKIASIINESHLGQYRAEFGHFELWMNTWVRIGKTPPA
jgi:SAM-dependent methyltransferase